MGIIQDQGMLVVIREGSRRGSDDQRLHLIRRRGLEA